MRIMQFNGRLVFTIVSPYTWKIGLDIKATTMVDTMVDMCLASDRQEPYDDPGHRRIYASTGFLSVKGPM